MTTVTVFVACDFDPAGPKVPIETTLALLQKQFKDVKIIPFFSNSKLNEIVGAFGAGHKDIGAMTGENLMDKIAALIKNCDFSVFDISGYKTGRTYCPNAIYELGIAIGLKAGQSALKMDARFFAKDGLKWWSDISDLSGKLPFVRDYKSFTELELDITDNLGALIQIRLQGAGC
jgi:hypothetical protein